MTYDSIRLKTHGLIMAVHTPVLLKEVIEYLEPKPGQIILDATFDGGGHGAAICKKIGLKGKLIGIDQDEEILKEAKGRIGSAGCRVKLINGNFRNLDNLLKNKNISYINGALFDLGMSSLQLENSGRGFSFLKNEPLIMTYKSEFGPNDLTAAQILNSWPKQEIFEILKEYGEEKYAKQISENIVSVRKKKRIITTFDLVDLIKKSIPQSRRKQRIHPATKTFQALRIAVNDELNALNEGLNKSWDLLVGGGRIVVISFHSLEDRIVKNFFRDKKRAGKGEVLTKKPIRPSPTEINENPRSRSAKLRAAIKL